MRIRHGNLCWNCGRLYLVNAKSGISKIQQSPKQQFLASLDSCFRDGSFIKLTLGHRAVPENMLRKLLVRPVLIRGEKRCSVVSRFLTRDETKNHPFSDTLALVEAKLGTEFLSANLFTESSGVELELGKKDRLRVISVKRKPASLDHDRSRMRWIDTSAHYLNSLEVTDSLGKVRERKRSKFRQIERFVDLLASAFRHSRLATFPITPRAIPITMCDMGSGKGYLTFAAFDYFKRVEKIEALITGVESRDDLVKLCNNVAIDCGFSGLNFVRSSIEEYKFPRLDILVALHACDIATDDALFSGISAGAEIILSAPCCHKEARPQIGRFVAHGPLRDILRNGIFAERHADMATDAIRQLILEREGYRVTVSEFVAAEHTAKNVMLIATKRSEVLTDDAKADIDHRIAELKNFYGIEHHRLEQLFMA